MFNRKKKVVPIVSLEESPLKPSVHSPGDWLRGVEYWTKPGGATFDKIILLPQDSLFILTTPIGEADPSDRGARYAGDKPELLSHVKDDWNYRVPGFTFIFTWESELGRVSGTSRIANEVRVYAPMEVLKDLSERTGVKITYPTSRVVNNFMERRARKCSR